MSPPAACWNCGFANPPGAKFCANCGKSQGMPCPACGTLAPEGARFCPNCGTALAQRLPAPVEPVPMLTEESRKIVTILFADLVGSTRLTERLDPEDAREVAGKFYEMVKHAVERWFQGTVANLLGDAVLAVFGFPTSHEDDPERAVRAGIAIRDAMPVLNQHLQADYGVQLAVRVGINTGEVVAASGSTFGGDHLVSDAVTTAYRLQETVEPGTVVVGERTYRLTREAIEYRELPALTVKGKETALRAWAAVRPRPERAEPQGRVTPFVGRQYELTLLRDMFSRTRDEQIVQMVTIFGQPGVGKSRLLSEFLAEVRRGEPAPAVLHGRSIAFGGQIGYHALLDILRGQAGLLDTDSTEVVRTKLAVWLETAAPGQDGLLEGLQLTFGLEDGVTGDPEQLRWRLFDSWRALLVGMAQRRSVILALEDLHWADDGVLELIQKLPQSMESVPLLVVCLARPELRERAAWVGGRKNTSSIDLEPLRPQETQELVGALASRGLAPELMQTVAQRAEGNPLFAEELVRMLLEGSAPATIPDTVQAVLTARIDRLLVRERRAVQAASVIGRGFWPSAVARIAGLSEPEVEAAIEELRAKEFVIIRPRSAIAGEREYAFRHILQRDVAYHMLPRSQRQRAHAEAARWMESRLGERVEEVIEILAEHLRLSGDDARAAPYLHRAGNKARRQYATADAIRLFDQAEASAAKAGADSQLLASIFLNRGEVRQLLGDYQAALADFERGLEAVRRAENRQLEGALENRIGLIAHRLARLDEAEGHFTRAADLARAAGDRLTLGQSLVDLANIAWDRGRMRPDHPALVEGLALLRQEDDRSGLARGLNLLCMGQIGAGHGEEAIAAAREALAAARAAGDKSKAATSLSYLCVVHGFLGRYREAYPFGEEAIRIAEEIGDRRRIAYTQFFFGRIMTNHGLWGEAVRQIERSRVLGIPRIQAPWSFLFLGQAYYLIGDLERARRSFQEGASQETHSPAWRQIALLSALHLAMMDGGAAIDPIVDEIRALPGGGFIPSDAETLLPVGEALLRRDRLDDLRAFVALRRPDIVKLNSPPHLAGIAIMDAEIAAREGRTADAARLLEDAVQFSLRSEDAIREWRARELRLRLASSDDDRQGITALIRRIVDRLDDEFRPIFLASPRVTPYLG